MVETVVNRQGTTLVAVVVTFNRLPKLQLSLSRLTEEVCDAIIVVDNCSTDGTNEWLASNVSSSDNVHVIRPVRNLGGAGGFEIGFRYAIEQYDPQWLVCFDDDAYPDHGSLQIFLDTDLGDADAAAAAVYMPDGSICEMNRPAWNPFWYGRYFFRTVLGGGRKGFHIADADYDRLDLLEIDTTSFVGFFVRARVVKRLGPPDGRLFIYGDDVLYSLGIRRDGGRILFVPSVKFKHDCSTFIGDSRVINPLWKVYYTYRNGLRVYHQAAGVWFWFVAPCKIILWLWRARLYSHPRKYLRIMRLALWDAVRQNYDRSHEEIQALCSEH